MTGKGKKRRTWENRVILAIILSQVVTLYPLLGIKSIRFVSLLNYLLMTTATLLMIIGVSKNRLKPGFFQVLFYLWILYIYITALPSITSGYMNYLYLKRFLTYFLFMYSIPLLMIYSLSERFIKMLFKIIYTLTCFYFLAILFGMGRVESTMALLDGVIILVMTLSYHSTKKKAVILLGIIVGLVFMMLAARRNRVVFLGGGLVLALIINIMNSKRIGSKFGWVLFSCIFSLALLVGASYFSLFFERMGEGMWTREVVIEYFFQDFNSTPRDWITGRGMYGEFFGGLANITDENTGMRDVIENGYLYLILKGGLIWVVLLVLFSLKAIYLGYFKSQNLLCKGFAMIILLYFVDMIGYGIPTTSMKYIMVFISIAGCNSDWLRNCSDEYLAKEIGLK